jgi:LPPG:FO 2-phospho-L-lactate transferase
MKLRKIVTLVGGVGGAKLAHGLAQVLPPQDLTIIVNTGDDFWHHGLRICPDLDTVMYTLGELVDPANGWGVRDDTTAALGALARYGADTWFRLGDQDIATHLLRTEALRRGERLTTVTQRLCASLGIGPAILPVTDDDVPTLIDTLECGQLAFQEYFVKHRWQPRVTALHYEGAERARISPEVEAALSQADAILIAPSNPWLSIAPMLAVPGMREGLARSVPRVAISPLIGAQAVKGPAAKLMAELGDEVSSAAVAEYYGEVINGFIYDKRDLHARRPQVRHLLTDTLMRSSTDRANLAQCALDWIESWSS